MPWLRAPLVPVALAVIAGMAGGALLPASAWWTIWLTGLGAAVVLLVLGRPVWTAAALLLAAAALGAVRALPAPVASHDVSRLELPREARLEGTLVSEPLRIGDERQRLVLEVAAADGAERSGRVQLTVHGESRSLHRGQRLAVNARLRRATGFTNPDGFDYAAFLARDGVHVLGAASAREVTVLDAATPWNVEVRRRAITVIDEALPPVSAALLGGLLLGARGHLPPDVLDGFRRAGVYHVLAVSGFNVALVASSVFAAMLVVRASRRAAAAGAILVIAGFALVVGSEPSVLRAVIMAVLVLVALLLDREASVLNSLALAALVILAARPGDLGDPGFQLSFAATLGIVVAPSAGPSAGGAGVGRWVRGAVGVSLAAQLAVLPVTLASFNQVSPIGVVANLFVVPLAGLATVLGLAAVTISTTSDVVAGVLFDATWPLLVVMRGIVHVAASVPGALVHLPAPHWTAIVAYVAGLVAALSAWAERHTRPGASRVAGALAFWLLLAAVAGAAWPMVRPGPGRLQISILDVGRGEAVVVEAPDGRALVILAGTRPESAERVIAPFLWNRGIRRIAGIVASEDARDTEARLRRLFLVDPTRDDPRLGAVEVAVVPSATGPPAAVRLEYGLASLVLVLDPESVPDGHAPRGTMLVLPGHGDADALSRTLVENTPSALTILAGGGRERGAPPRETLAHLATARGPFYRTDRDGAVLVETDGRRLHVTRWATRATEHRCLDPEWPGC